MEYSSLFEAQGTRASRSTGGQRRHKLRSLARGCSLGAVALVVAGCGGGNDSNTQDLVAQGKAIFRFDTFGDETLWTDTLRIHEVVRSAISPVVALAVGLKVDADALPAEPSCWESRTAAST